MARKWDVNVIWPTTAIGKYPQIYVKRTINPASNQKLVDIEVRRGAEAGQGFMFRITKRQARMLARRLMQALEYK
jgi:hypothetical protein